MEMDRVGLLAMVNKPYNTFGALLLHEGGTRGDAIIANKSGSLEVWIDLRLELLDLNLIVLDFGAGDWVIDRIGRPAKYEKGTFSSNCKVREQHTIFLPSRVGWVRDTGRATCTQARASLWPRPRAPDRERWQPTEQVY